MVGFQVVEAERLYVLCPGFLPSGGLPDVAVEEFVFSGEAVEEGGVLDCLFHLFYPVELLLGQAEVV